MRRLMRATPSVIARICRCATATGSAGAAPGLTAAVV